MTRYLKLLIINLICALVVVSTFKIAKVSANSNSAEIVMEVNTGRILHSFNANVKKPMASTTKVLTAITIIDNCNVEDKVKISKESVGIEGSSIYLQEGELLTVKELLYGLMLRSGNDTATALALYKSGSIENFATLMNETARKIGATNSNFTNPHGLHDDNHYTTAKDLAVISCYAMKNDIFREIVGTKKIIIPNTVTGTPRLLLNKNKMLNLCEGSTGIKTGYTKKAGRCLVSSAKRNGMEVVCVVLNCPPMFEQSIKLINDSFSLYAYKKLVEKNSKIADIKLAGSNKTLVAFLNEDLLVPIKENEINDVRIEYNLKKEIKFSLNSKNECGKINVYVKNELIFSQKVYTMLSVEDNLYLTLSNYL